MDFLIIFLIISIEYTKQSLYNYVYKVELSIYLFSFHKLPWECD
jgi:hypothetical protein